MNHESCIINRRGVTLIELIVVVSVIGILVIALGFSFQGWMGKYRVESQIKEMYTDLMNAKAGAIQRNRMYFVTLTTTQYTIYEDTNDANDPSNPDGDEAIQTGADRLVLQKNLNPTDPITWNGVTPIDFTKKGLVNGLGNTICSNKDVDTDYDCIIISALRVNTGKLTTKIPPPYNGVCDADNCVAK